MTAARGGSSGFADTVVAAKLGAAITTSSSGKGDEGANPMVMILVFISPL